MSELYADVVVRQGRRVAGPFSYAVPAEMRERVALGQLVWVPFRRSHLPAIVVGLSDKPPEFDTRPLEGILDQRPVVTELQLRLASWIAQYYFCSLAEAVFAMVPPGVVARVYRVVVLTEGGRSRDLQALAPPLQRLIEELRAAGGEMPERELCRKLGRKSVSGSLHRLVRQGWLQRETRIAEPETRPHYDRFLVLCGSEEDIARYRAKLQAGRRPSVAARILEALARAPAGEREWGILQREVKATGSALKHLEEAGLVRREADRFFVLAERPEKLRSLAPQVPILRELLGADGRLEVSDPTALVP
ncbi:MAG: hypothetical protein ACP5SI_01575, partial [Chloroflexia bacterium]